ncbi:MAG: DUF2057 family protein [Candidatus Thiodiazotropha sp.]
MTLNSLITLIICIAITAPAHASRLTLGDGFEFDAVDGEAVNGSPWSQTDSIELTPGRHEVSLYYRDMVFDPDLGYEQLVQSRPFTVTLIAQPGVNYRLVADDSGLVDRFAFARRPLIAIHTDGAGVEIASERSLRTTPAGENVDESVPGDETGTSRIPNTVADQLRHWWSKADLETRQAFMGWIVEQ